jgi:hypothetical protein
MVLLQDRVVPPNKILKQAASWPGSVSQNWFVALPRASPCALALCVRVRTSRVSGQLAAEYGFTDLDGSRPDVWRYNQAVEDGDQNANPSDYR